MTPKKAVLAVGPLFVAVAFLVSCGRLSAAEGVFDPAAKKVALALHAGPYDRSDAFVTVLIDGGKAHSVFVEYADGKLGRAQLVAPGMLNAAARGTGKKELHFAAPKMAKGETARVIAALSERPVEGRTYVWSGEARQNRRVSCMDCHQGLAKPTAEELRQEAELLEKTGQVPPLQLPRLLPTAQGGDARWHEKLGRNCSSACWECHARHMVQYEFGQSLARDVPGAPDPPQSTKDASPPAVRSVFHTVFRVREGRTVSHPLAGPAVSSEGPATWAMHYGFDRATAGGEAYSPIIQQHAGTLSEEAGKFLGRHSVRIDWVGKTGATKKLVAREERQVTVKDWRGRNKSYAIWIDLVSTLTSAAGALQLDGTRPPAGFCFVPALDAGTTPEYREASAWKALTFVSEGTTYTAVCFNQSTNPPPRAAEPTDRDGRRGVGCRFSAKLDAQRPLVVHYRLWLQGGNMPAEEIQARAQEFLTPITVELK